MFDFIGNFFGGAWYRLRLTVREMQYALLIVSVLTIIGILPPLFGAPVKHSFWLPALIVPFSVWRLCGLRRYITTHFAGEAGEIAVAAGSKKFENQSLLDNELAAVYRKLIVFVLTAQSSIFILAAVFFNYLDGSRTWFPAVIIIIFWVSLWAPHFSMWTLGIATVASVIFILALAAHSTIPQTSLIPGVSKVVAKMETSKLAGKNARILENVDVLREKQRQNNLGRVITKITKWQLENPGRDIPYFLKDEREAAELGLTLPEIYEKRHRAMPKEELVKTIRGYLSKGRDLKLLNAYCQQVWQEHETAEKQRIAAAAPPQPAPTPAPAPKPQPKPVVVVEAPTQSWMGWRDVEIEGVGVYRMQVVRLDKDRFEMVLPCDNGRTNLSATRQPGSSEYRGSYEKIFYGSPRVERGDFVLNIQSGNISGWMGWRGGRRSFRIL